MSQEEGSPYLERITGLKERVGKLEEKGVNVTKVNKILSNLESTVDTVIEVEKVEEAFSKFENLISKMESKGKTTKRKKVMKKKVEPPADEEKKDDPPAPETSGILPEDEVEPPVEEAKEEAPEEEKKEEPPEEEKKEEPPEEEPIEDSAEEIPTKTETVEINSEQMDREIKIVDDMARNILELSGDPSPIKPHMDALKQARDDGDVEGFQNYLTASKDWLIQYLFTLHKANIDDTIEMFNSRVSDLSKVDEEDRAKDLKIELEGALVEYENADLEALAGIEGTVKEIWGRMEEIFNSFTEELTVTVNESTESIEAIIGDLSEEIDITVLKDQLQEVKEHLFNQEYIEARLKSQELLITAVGERDGKDMMKLESLLLSIEPLISKIEMAEGPDSDIFKALSNEREYIIERSKTDVKDSLQLMEELLDKTTKAAADIEEKNIKGVEERIKTYHDEVSSLSDTIDVSPILNILEKARNMLMDGDVDKSIFMLDKAETAFGKLKEKQAVEVASYRINDLTEKMTTLGSKGIDISPLETPLSSASDAIASGDMEKFEDIMASIDEKFQFIRNEELKVDYQKGLIRVVNKIKELKDDGQETSDLEEDMETFKTKYMERHYEEAVSGTETLLQKIGGRMLYKVIFERKKIVEDTLKEAEGLLVEVEIPSEKFASANELIEQKEYEKALDILIEAQVELEETMTQRTFSLVENEIRDLVKECIEYSVDPGDYENIITTAYSMADEEKFREAMELLSRFRERLTRKVATYKVEDHMKKMTQLLKKGRTAGIVVTPYKASMTKSKVLLEAGDVDSAFQLISRQVDTLDSLITERRALIARMDKLRGNLLAQEGKLSRLERSGVVVDSFKERVNVVKQLIEDSDHEEAEKELLAMDKEINIMLTKKPEQLKKEMMTTIMQEQETRPLSIDRLKPVQRSLPEGPIDPDQARNELFTLIPKIKVEITRLHARGLETDEYKMDIERIQNLVMHRQYVQAYELGRDCFLKMTS